MTQKERKQEQADINDAVHVLSNAITHIAHRKARAYELQILQRVRDELDLKIQNTESFNEIITQHIEGNMIKELNKK